MTKKDYVAIAKVLRIHRRINRIKGAESQRFRLLVYDMCSMLKADNDNFSRDKFTNFVFEDEIGAGKFVE